MQPTTITREFTDILSARLKNWPKLIQIVIGPRQVGKTTGVMQVFDQFSGPKHFATADLSLPPSAEWIIQQWNRVRSMGDSDSLLVLDEIQKIERWSEVVKRLFDEDRQAGKLRVVLLGSASLNLSRGMSDSLAGRFETIQVPHWSFDECAKAFKFTFEQFLKFGGYPGATPLIEDAKRWKAFMSESIIFPVIHRDIPSLQEIRKPALFQQLFELALNYPAQEISYQKLLGQLQESGNVSTIKHYIQVLADAFLLRTLEKYSTRPISIRASSPKIIPLCPALINAVTDPLRLDYDKEWRGRVFEACVGAQLLRSRGKLYYWRDGKYEVDFVLNRDGILLAFEIKSNTRKPVGGLNAFTQAFNKAIGISVDEKTAIALLSAKEIDTFIDNEFLGKKR